MTSAPNISPMVQDILILFAVSVALFTWIFAVIRQRRSMKTALASAPAGTTALAPVEQPVKAEEKEQTPPAIPTFSPLVIVADPPRPARQEESRAEHRPAVVTEFRELSGSMPLRAMNLTTKAQVLRLHRRGEPLSRIAGVAGVPQSEVNLMIKLDGFVRAKSNTPNRWSTTTLRPVQVANGGYEGF